MTDPAQHEISDEKPAGTATVSNEDRARVRIVNRVESGQPGFMTVNAHVDGGENGEYTVANHLVGTDDEVAEILTQSGERADTRSATAAGTD